MATSPRLTITETEPTPLVTDFATFVHYLAEHRVLLTKTNAFLPRKVLYELNHRMTHPLSDVTPRTDQPLYPLLHFLYHLSLAGKLLGRVPVKGRVTLSETERLGMYEELSATEKYFFLLETLWVDADWEKLQAGYFGRAPLLDMVSDFLAHLGSQQPGKTLRVKRGLGSSHLAQMLWNWEYLLLYFSFLGFWEVTRDEGKDHPKRHFRAKSLTPTVFGVTMGPILAEARDLPCWNLPDRRQNGEWKAVPGSPLPEWNTHVFAEAIGLRKGKTVVKVDKGKPGDPFFLPFVSLFEEGALQQKLPREELKFIDGTYVLKVALHKDLWRRVEMSAKNTLLDLHRAIQGAYRFDDDHLYSFFMDGKAWSYEKFTSPYDDEGPYVDEVRIGEIGLLVGQTFLYLFDYGDEWRFQVTLEEIRTEGPKPRKPRITEKKGKAPQQYGNYW